jgi:hypothetical protein
VTVVSPHFDDVPLSLGQSLSDGVLSRCDVRVRVAFGRTNWSTWLHPTERRAPLVSWWRTAEEQLAAVSFGYRFTVARWPEALLRLGAGYSDRLLDAEASLTDDPLIAELAGWLADVASPTDGASPDALLVAAGLGGHVDHRLLALAASSVGRTTDTPVGFYEDRPYSAYLDEREIRRQLEPLGHDLERHPASGPISARTQWRAKRCYPSQMSPYFDDAMRLDVTDGATEAVWFPRGVAPRWWH